MLNNPERQELVEKLADRLESGADIGEFSQGGHFASIAQLNMSYDDYMNNKGISRP
ncbi:hypothetical protein [Maribrevibacterium harenarium]|uniref:hypothetical protein n=1 Tax=Maribrevibacterium harenarium TaxID=2589817 RepID=UPI0015E3CEFF|nr:hypothetical protein [Maribrevibacterium harenarium]